MMTMGERDVKNGTTPRSGSSAVEIERWLRHGDMVNNSQPQNPPGIYNPFFRRRSDDLASTSLSGDDLGQSFQRMSLGGRSQTSLALRSALGLGLGYEYPSLRCYNNEADTGSTWMNGLGGGFGYSDSFASRNSGQTLVNENSFYTYQSLIAAGSYGGNGLNRTRLNTNHHHQSYTEYEGFKCEESFILSSSRRSPAELESEAEYEQQRMVVLESFRAMAAQRGFVYLMAMDQSGCRNLQKVFEQGTREDVDLIFESVIEHIVELSTDPFGNYLVQKLLDVCVEEQRRQIVYAMTVQPQELIRISLNAHGTRVVQKLIETATNRWAISLIMSGLKPGILDLIMDLNGNHVLQSCLKCLSNQDNAFIFAAATRYALEVSTHRHGCCVMQKCIERSSGSYQLDLVTEILNHAVLLAADPYGNYVIQFIIDQKMHYATAQMLSRFRGRYVLLSTQKCGSHVVEKCLKEIHQSRDAIVAELLSETHFEQLLQDPYANYVIQSALNLTKGKAHNALYQRVCSHNHSLRASPFCKKILTQTMRKK